MNKTLQNLMQKATQLTQSGRLTEATELIQRLLHSQTGDHAQPPPQAQAPAARAADAPLVLDDCVFEVNTPKPGTAPEAANRPATPAAGEFISGTHTHANLTRRYKLYIPPGHAGKALPLVVMLHGCTQNPDDFAAGTGMNQRAQAQGFFVLYPEQSSEANPQACWNWFKHNHQKRGSGEPALIASLTQAVTQHYGLDARRVYVAGLSAGGAMAAVLAAAYPDIYAAVGVHSGLPAGAASNVAQALMVMKSGHSGISLPGKGRQDDVQKASEKHPPITIPTIVFHGDDDKTVHPRNGEKLIAAVRGHSEGSAKVEQGVSTKGRRYTRCIRHGDQGNALSEHWLVHGGGHAWSGGLAAGSYTDIQGPDATGEILRFFFSQRL
ncbi:PHB depolymerase family esterase [Rhodoferax sp. 4810]|nr:PHB depolymerase family esterase [Rhodoferax jenense]